jgi:hypothetical protein
MHERQLDEHQSQQSQVAASLTELARLKECGERRRWLTDISKGGAMPHQGSG